MEIQHREEGVTVHCSDGSIYQGDVLAGAEGVHSKVRSEIWRASNEADAVIPESEQKPLNAVFGCLFGVSRPIEGIGDVNPDIVEFIPDQGHCIM